MPRGGFRAASGRPKKKKQEKTVAAPVGRPTIDPDRGESHHIGTRINKTDAAFIQQLCESHKISVAEWLRGVISTALANIPGYGWKGNTNE